MPRLNDNTAAPGCGVRRRVAARMAAGAGALLCALGPGAHTAVAQVTVISESNTTAGAIGDGTACVGAQNQASGTTGFLTRTFQMTGLPPAQDIGGVDIGFMADHTWRGDIEITLENPSGQIATVVARDLSVAVNNYNMELRQGRQPTVNTNGNGTDHTTADTVTAADVANGTYQNFVGTTGSLANLFTAGNTMNGTWTMRMCDAFITEDSGQFRRGELSFLPKASDLELSVTAANATPPAYSTTTVSYVLGNSGPNDQTNATVALTLPPGVTAADITTTTGSFSNGVWTVPALAAGTSAQLDVSLDVGSTPLTLSGDVASADLPDPDSAAGNNNTAEDDYDTVTVTPQPSTGGGTNPPPLVCSFNPQYLLAWDDGDPDYDWPEGTAAAPVLSQSYSVTAPPDPNFPGAQPPIPFSLTLSGDTGALRNANGTGTTATTPVTQSAFNGGFAGEQAVQITVDFASNTEAVTMVMALGIPAEGVEGVQFTISDIDRGTYTDQISVFGSANGSPIGAPTLSLASNVQSGGPNLVFARNSGINVPGNSGAGNVTVTFDEPVDTINFTYDNGPDAQANPGPQAIALSNIRICRRNLPEVSAVKSVEVFDPSNQGLLMTPGNEVLYKITATNAPSAQAAAKDVDIVDTLPNNLRFVSVSQTGFSGGAFTSSPSQNTDCDSGACVVSFTGAELPIGATGEVVVRALIK